MLIDIPEPEQALTDPLVIVDAMESITGFTELIKIYRQPEQDGVGVLVEMLPYFIDAMEALTGFSEPPTVYRPPTQDGLVLLVETKAPMYMLV